MKRWVLEVWTGHHTPPQMSHWILLTASQLWIMASRKLTPRCSCTGNGTLVSQTFQVSHLGIFFLVYMPVLAVFVWDFTGALIASQTWMLLVIKNWLIIIWTSDLRTGFPLQVLHCFCSQFINHSDGQWWRTYPDPLINY